MVEHFRGFFVVGIWFEANLGQKLPVFCSGMVLNWPLIALSTDLSFFIHGSRFMHESSNLAMSNLSVGEKLRVCFEANNPATGWAIQLQIVNKPQIIGYVPRYLLPDLHSIRKSDDQEFLSAVVTRVNPAPAPLKQRFLVELAGRLPVGQAMMSSTEFEVLS